MISTARSMGKVRVIVGLAGTVSPQGKFDTEEKAAARRLAIRATRNALLKELDGMSFKVIRTYETIPYLVIEAGPDALEVLEHSENVVSVEEDRVLRPNSRR
jgi:hypothetical protein